MDDTIPSGYRANVGAVIISRHRRIWLGKRIAKEGEMTMANAWQMPQGGIENGEQPEEAARREVYEETGITSLSHLATIPHWITYDLPAHLVGSFWDGRYRGQAQRWLAFKFVGEDSEIQLGDPQSAHVEFGSWRWATAQEAARRAIYFKRQVYREVLGEFAHLLD